MKIQILKSTEELFYVVDPSKDRTTAEYIVGIVSLLETGVIPDPDNKKSWYIEDLRKEDFNATLPEVWYEDKAMALAVAAGYFGDGDTPIPD